MLMKKYELYMEESKVWKDDFDMTSSSDIYDYLTSEHIRLDRRDREIFVVIAINAKGSIIGYNESSIGDICSSVVSPREVLKFAIMANAAGIIIAHNHPSGCPEESHADISATRRINEACDLIGIHLLYHTSILVSVTIVYMLCYNDLRNPAYYKAYQKL